VIFLLSFFSYAIGILSATINWLIAIAIIPLLVYLLLKKQSKYYALVLLLLFIFGIIRSYLYLPGKNGEIQTYGIVFSAKSNYALICSFKGNYYIQGNYEVGDILKVTGHSFELSFAHYESSFDFEKYLNNKFVFHEIKSSEISTIFKSPIRINAYKSFCLYFLDDKVYKLITSILFGDFYSDDVDLASLGILRFFSLSGFHISFIFSFIDNHCSDKSKKLFNIFKTIIFCILLSFSNFKFAFIRLFIDSLLKILLKKKKIEINRFAYISLLGIILLVINPNYIQELGFIYTFILLFTIELLKTSSKKEKKIKSYIINTFILLPLIIYDTKNFNPLTFIVGYLFSPIFLALFIFSLPLLIFPNLGIAINYLGRTVLFIISKLNVLSFAKIPSHLSLIFIIVFYLIFLFLCYFKYISFSLGLKTCLSVQIAVIVISLVPFPKLSSYIRFIDVGQGDATLIQIKNKNYLFDTGGNIQVDLATECLIPYFNKIGISSLDAVFITHRDYDHYGALDSLQKNFEIKNIYYNDISNLSFNNMDVKNINTFKDQSSENHDSAVYYVTIKNNVNLLIMGDAPKEIESSIMNKYDDIKCDFLKVGHHGANTSSSFSFLSWIKPKVAIISCGENNRYGHPHQEVLNNLEALKIQYRRTDKEGTIVYKI